MSVLLLRHGEPNWRVVNERRWPGLANDLAPLTDRGQQQARSAAEELSCRDVRLVLTSPMTRAMHTAAIVATGLAAPLRVELELREWLPDETYGWTSPAEVAASYNDMLANDGVRPPGNLLRWEPLSAVRDRALGVLQPHLNGEDTVVAVCHAVLIHALTGHARTPYAGIRVCHGKV